MTAAIPLTMWEGRPVDAWRELWRLPDLRIYDVVGSTNDIVRALAESDAPEGTTVIAEEQRAGRGRAGRRWHASRGRALLMSVLFRPRKIAQELFAPGAVPLRVGLAVARAAEAAAGSRIGLKWPNDVVIEGRGKVGGILCEGVIGATGAFVVVGIGINVNQDESDFQGELTGSATSLKIASGAEISRAALTGALLSELYTVARKGSEPLDSSEVAEIGRRDVLQNRAVTVDGVPRGMAVGIASDGALMIRGPDDRITPVHTGTVRVLTRQEPGNRETYP